MQRLKILDRTGFLKARSIVEAILPKQLASELVALNQHMVRKHIDKIGRNGPDDEVNVWLLNEVKAAFGFETDSDLAEFLHVEHNTVATIRAGRAALGPKPRLRILERITNEFSADALLQTIESSEKLMGVINLWLMQHRRPSLPSAR